jgi:GDSL-like Lipase/Acylhydrolase family
MLDCLILGDSIAVGTKMFAPTECVAYAKGGYNSWQWNKRWGDKPLDARVVVISLGTNDHKYVKTEHELRKMRERILVSKVIWIMPPCNEKFCKANVNAIVEKLAHEYGDHIISTKHVQPDHIHPSWSGYKELVRKAEL